MQLDIARLVYTVDVTEAGRDGEVRTDGGEGLVDVVDIFGLGIQRVIVDVFVIDAILLSSGNSDFLSLLVSIVADSCPCLSYHFKPLLHWRRTLQVLRRCFDVEIYFFL